MKIGFYSPYLDTFGGGERYMLTLASHLSLKNDVDIFWDDATIKAPLSKFLKIDLSRVHFKENIFHLPTIKKLRRSRSYKLIFVLSDGSVPLTFAKTNILHFQVPFRFNKLSLKTKLALKKYKYIVTNSHFTKSFIDKSFNVNSKVIYPPVDTKSFQPKVKENIILNVGRFGTNQLHPKKQEVLIDVFKEVYKHAPGWRLYLVGQAKKSDQKYIRHLKKVTRGHAIKIIENIPIDRLKKIFEKSSIYWHATGFGEDENLLPEKMEHFGIATVEAQAAGAVPVVIGKGGQKEIVNDARDGYLWNTKTELFDKTMHLINDPKKREQLSTNAIKNAKRFSKEVFLKEYEEIIFPR